MASRTGSGHRLSRAVAAGIGTAGSLIAAAIAVLLLVSATIAFKSWPVGSLGGATQRVVIAKAPSPAGRDGAQAPRAAAGTAGGETVPDASPSATRTRRGRAFDRPARRRNKVGLVRPSPRAGARVVPPAPTAPPASQPVPAPTPAPTPTSVRDTVKGAGRKVRDGSKGVGDEVGKVNKPAGQLVTDLGATAGQAVEDIGDLLPQRGRRDRSAKARLTKRRASP